MNSLQLACGGQNLWLQNGFFGNLWKWYAPERKLRAENGGLSCGTYPICIHMEVPPPHPPGSCSLYKTYIEYPPYRRSFCWSETIAITDIVDMGSEQVATRTLEYCGTLRVTEVSDGDGFCSTEASSLDIVHDILTEPTIVDQPSGNVWGHLRTLCGHYHDYGPTAGAIDVQNPDVTLSAF